MKRENWIAFLPFYLLVMIVFLGIAQWGSDAVTAINQNTPPARVHRIVIDPGHGGIDGGATSCTGVLESNLNLEIALRLEDMMHFLGYETVMLRKEDISIYTEGNTIAAQKISDLKERVRIVNETEGAVLISIHQNTFPDGRYGGAQVFFAPNEASKRFAKMLQSNIISTVNPESKRLSKKSDGIYLMEHIDCTGVLVECGFLSNPTEEAKLRNPEYQKKLCTVFAASMAQFLTEEL